MRNLQVTLWILLVCCLALEIVKSESNEAATKEKGDSNKATVIEKNENQPEKRDSQKQEGIKNNNKARQQQFSNDEPFKPIYRPAYFQQYNAVPKREQHFSQAVAPQAETYYDKLQFTNGIRYVAPSRNEGNSGAPANIPAHSAAPLVGSYISSSIGGARSTSDAYRGAFNLVAPVDPVAAVYSPKAELEAHKQTTGIAPSSQKVKVAQYNSAYAEPATSFLFDRKSKQPLQQKGEQVKQHQQRLILQPLHQHPHQHQQPYFQFYNPHQHQSLHHQQFNVRAIPQQQQQQQQQHFQYIVAIPLSYIRQMQHQLATGLSTPSLRHEVPLSASKSVSPVTAQPIIGPLARDHYGSYRPVHYTSNHQAQHVAPSAQHYSNQKPQYTTQYIQIPTSVLHAAAQAAHAYQSPQPEQEQQKASFQQSQPQYTYNIYQQQQQAYENEQGQQTQHHAQVYVQPLQEKPQTQKPLQETIIHVGGAKPNAKSTPTKTYNDNNQIPPTPTSTTPFKAPAANSIVPPTASADAAQVVHYNPIYVQGPPPEQQSLFGTLDYQRFATGGFHATTPVPFVRLSATSPHHYYTSLPQHQYPYQQQEHQHHQHLSQSQLQPFYTGLGHKTIYGGYASEQIPNIVSAGLPYLNHPGGVHYGTHLYHPAPAYFASPSIPAKATETANGSLVNNQHQQPEQHQQSLHPQYASFSSGTSLQSLRAEANVAPTTTNESAESSPLVKYP